MKFNIYFLFLLYPIIINSQDIKKTDLIGNWTFKKYVITKEMPQDTIIKLGEISIEYGKSTDLKFSDITISKNTFQENDYKSDLWEFSNYEITPHLPVSKNDLEFYKKHSVGVIEKLENGKYYFTKPRSIKILSLNKKLMIIEDHYYNLIYERE